MIEVWIRADREAIAKTVTRGDDPRMRLLSAFAQRETFRNAHALVIFLDRLFAPRTPHLLPLSVEISGDDPVLLADARKWLEHLGTHAKLPSWTIVDRSDPVIEAPSDAEIEAIIRENPAET